MTDNNKVSSPGVYRGYSEAIYDGRKRFSEYITMRDGVKIAIDYYRPVKAGVLEEKPLPVVWIFTPYDYRTMAATGKSIDGSLASDAPDEDIVGTGNMLVSYGYIFAIADVRGTGASFGFRPSASSNEESEDAYEICEWLGTQDWSDGNVGMYGFSYFGNTTLLAMRGNPPHLKAVVTGQTDIDKYDCWNGGGIGTAMPIEMGDEYEVEYNTVPVGNPDDDEAKEVLKIAVRQHKYNNRQWNGMRYNAYRNSFFKETDSFYWIKNSNTTYLDKLKKADVAVLLYGGWRDVFRRGTVQTFCNLSGKCKMLMGPWHHMDKRPGFDLAIEELRFFDYYLKGIKNGFADEPPIYFSMDNADEDKKWQYAYDWPVPGYKYSSWFFSGGRMGTAQSCNDGSLICIAPEDEEAKDRYKVDYTITEDNDSCIETVQRDKIGLTYTSDPLEEDLEVLGHPLADIWVSVDSEEHDDVDIFVFIEDIDEKGNGRYVTDGHLRASMRATAEPPYDFLGLPWHRCYKEDEQKLKRGKPYCLPMDLQPISYIFKAGHRIRVAITCALDGMVFLEEDVPPEISVYTNSIYTSYVRMPVKEENTTDESSE